jgi:ATP-dependent DNA helicase RecG
MSLNIENQNTEFKLNWRDECLKTICAFANTRGGILYIGVNDDGTIAGITDVTTLLEELPNKINNKLSIIPSVTEKTEDALHYIEIIIEPSTVAISYNGKYYIRSGSTTQELNGTSLSDFLQRKLGRTWDGIVSTNYDDELIDTETVMKFKNRALDRIPSIGQEKNNKDILNKLYLLENVRIKNAGILLFYKNPQAVFLQSKIKIGKFLNDADVDVQDVVDRNLLNQAINSIDILTNKYLRRFVKYSKDKIERRDELEYPIEALREAIYNAIVHRDYSSTAEISIRVYEDKLVIINPGILPPEIDIASLRTTHLSRPRNPFIADVFQKAGYIEAWGRGTNKIIQVCKEAGLIEPEFKSEDGVFKITLFRDIYTPENFRRARLNDRQIKAILYVKKNHKITNSEYQKINEIGKRQASLDLEELQNKGFIVKIGTTGRGTHYILKGQ